MDWQTLALSAAGAIGAGVALFHGFIIQCILVTPLAVAGPQQSLSGAARRLIPPLLHFSTFAWFAGGVALIGAALWLDRKSAIAVAVLVGLLDLFGAVFNFRATRGRHLGWLLMAIAVALITSVAIKPGV